MVRTVTRPCPGREPDSRFPTDEASKEDATGFVELLRTSGGQSVITTTDSDHVPGADGADVRWLEVSDGRVLEGELAAR